MRCLLSIVPLAKIERRMIITYNMGAYNCRNLLKVPIFGQSSEVLLRKVVGTQPHTEGSNY